MDIDTIDIIIFNWFKEIYDSLFPNEHTVELMDIVFTLFGGICVFLIALLFYRQCTKLIIKN